MTSLTIAYLLVWGTVVAYVAWAGLEQRRLSIRVAELESRLEDHDATSKQISRAA